MKKLQQAPILQSFLRKARIVRKVFTTCAALLTAFGLTSVVAHAPVGGGVAVDRDQNPNILWIIAEDMGPDLGVYSTAEARTPNIDGVANKGMVFERAFTTAPICSISRSALFTGMYATSIGAHQHRTPRERKTSLPDGVRLLMDRFRDAGYYTALVKDIADEPADVEWIEGAAKKDWNFSYEGQPYDGDSLDGLVSNQPFFAQIQFHETHRGKGWDEARHKIPSPADPNKIALPPYYPDHPVARRDWAEYLNNVMLFDRKVGYVLDRIEEIGLSDNTIVFIFADHGRAMPRAKQWLYDSGLQIPLIVYVPKGLPLPKGFTPGARSQRLVSGIDLPATALAFAGVERGANMQGRPFLGTAAQPRKYVFSARDRADETVDQIRAVRDSRFLYIRNFMPERPYSQLNRYKEKNYPILRLMFRLHNKGLLSATPSLFMADRRPEEELYDTIKDPYNVVNLALDPAYGDELKKYRAVLEVWRDETNDHGLTPEPSEVAAAFEKRAIERNEQALIEIAEIEGPWRKPLD